MCVLCVYVYICNLGFQNDFRHIIGITKIAVYLKIVES